MGYPIALIFAVAASKDKTDIFKNLSDILTVESVGDPGILQTIIDKTIVRFGYMEVVSSATIPTRLSTGDKQLWTLLLLQPYDEHAAEYVKAFRDKVITKEVPTLGKYPVLGPMTPDEAKKILPASVWQSIEANWWTYWRGEASPEGIAAQKIMKNEDLEKVILEKVIEEKI